MLEIQSWFERKNGGKNVFAPRENMATRVRIRIIESIENPVRFFAVFERIHFHQDSRLLFPSRFTHIRFTRLERDFEIHRRWNTVGFFVIKTRSDSLSLSKLDKVDNRYSFLSLFGQKKSVPREFINWIQTVRYFKLATYIIN